MKRPAWTVATGVLIVGKLSQVFGSTKEFVGNVRNELKKASWPTRPELAESTMVIIISVIMLAAFVGLSDRVLAMLIRLVVQAG